jgi:hypothetical protein
MIGRALTLIASRPPYERDVAGTRTTRSFRFAEATLQFFSMLASFATCYCKVSCGLDIFSRFAPQLDDDHRTTSSHSVG